MPRKWFVFFLLALTPLLAIIPGGCTPPGDIGVALLVSSDTLDFGKTTNQLSLQVSSIASVSQLQPITAEGDSSWIRVEDCNSAGDQCMSNGPAQQVNIRISVLRDQMNFGTNRGKVILKSDGAAVKTVDVVAEDTLQAAFSADQRRPQAGQPVQFTDLSLADSPILTHHWDFGDGASSSDLNPAHIYTNDGVYNVSLTVTTANAQETATLTAYITVATSGVHVDFAADRTAVPLDGAVYFTNMSVSPSAPIVSYAWDFGDGGQSNDQSPSHQYRTIGPKTVSLTVTTTQGASTATKTNYIMVQSQLGPTAKIAISQVTPYVDIAVRFDDISDPGASPIVNRVWEFGDGLSSIETSPSHVFRGVGAYIVKLTVITAQGTSAAQLPITVDFKPPHADFTVSTIPGAPKDTTATNPDTLQDIQFSDRSSAGSAPVRYWAWDFGDGKSSTEQNPIHHYNSVGLYTVKLTARTSSTSAPSRANFLRRRSAILMLRVPISTVSSRFLYSRLSHTFTALRLRERSCPMRMPSGL